MKTFYISTSIPYVNARPHIGYALEAVQTDTIARFYRQLGVETFFLSGTDENAIKNVESAEKLGLSTRELVDKNTKAFLELKEALNLSFDQFIRTSSEKHKKGAQKFWEACKKDIYKKTYEGLYCTGCETFYTDGEFPENICPYHNRKLELVSEENYFFKLSHYQHEVKKIILSGKLQIFPEFRKEEVLDFINKGIDDISVSRPKERTKGWGIPVPGDESQHMYVWFDALTNYITGIDFADNGPLFKKFWELNDNRNHVIGKDIVKFHALYWPAMLLSAGIPLPTRIYAHGFITVEGKKMSKTLGNVVDPFTLVEKYGVDALRYYLLREIPSLDDGDFSHHRMEQIYDNDLANELGNCVSRITTLAQTDSISVKPSSPEYDEEFHKNIEVFDLNRTLETLWQVVRDLNKSINEFEPWKKTAGERKDFLITSVKTLNTIGWKLQPFLPDTAKKILSATEGNIVKAPQLFPKK